MSSTLCARHPTEAATTVCVRCGDFTCPRCRTEAGGLCLGCATRAPATPAGPLATLGLAGAILFAVLAGGLVLLTSTLTLWLTGGKTVGIPTWNIAVGLIYVGIAIGLWKREPKGYQWSIGSQGLNALLSGYRIVVAVQEPKPNVIHLAILGLTLFFSVGGWICTFLAKPLFNLTPPMLRRPPGMPRRALPAPVQPVDPPPPAPPANPTEGRESA